jgi:hypothetical protein
LLSLFIRRTFGNVWQHPSASFLLPPCCRYWPIGWSGMLLSWVERGRGMPRTKLTDRYLKSLKPTSDGRPYEMMDSVVSQMGVRVMGTASHIVLTFILIARYPPSKHPTRRALGAYLDEVAPEF